MLLRSCTILLFQYLLGSAWFMSQNVGALARPAVHEVEKTQSSRRVVLGLHRGGKAAASLSLFKPNAILSTSHLLPSLL